MLKVPVIPDWLNDLPDHATIGSSEIAEIYGIHITSINRCLEHNNVPEVLYRCPRTRGKPKLKWKLGDIRADVKAKQS